MNSLSDRHWHELTVDSAIAPAIVGERGAFTAYAADQVPEMFAAYQRRPGLVFPVRGVTGQIVTYQLKADDPRKGTSGKPLKYDTAANGRMCLDVPAGSRPLLGDSSKELWITEGIKKVDSGLSHGIECIVGLLGVWNFRGKNEHGGITALADWDSIALNGRDVVIAYDSDVMANPKVHMALERLSAFLTQRGARVRYCLMPDLPNGEKCGLDDFFAAGGTRLQLDAYIPDALPGAQDIWEPPIPLDDPVGPPFPVDALPGTIGAYVLAVAEQTQTPVDMAATVVLGTLSASAGGKYEIVIDEVGWREPAHTQMIVVAEPGQRKTGIFRIITKPLVDHELSVNKEERRALAEWESQERALVQQLQAAEKAGARPDHKPHGDADLLRTATVEALEEHRAARRRLTQIIADDVTPEAVKSLLAEQGGHIAVMSAESTFFSITAGARYSDSPNLDVLLNGHAGDRIRVDRKGRPSEIVERPCLTLCLMLQSEVLRSLGQSPGFITRGAAARLLPSLPPDMLGRRRVDVQPVPDDVAEEWANVVKTTVKYQGADEDGAALPWALRLDPYAKAIFRDYRIRHEADMGRDGPYADIREWTGKQEGAVLRIAGLLHAARHEAPENVDISGDSIRRAIAIMDYFAEHARIMYRLMRGQSNHAHAQTVLDAIDAIRDLGGPITQREVHRRLRGRVAFESSRSLDGPLAVLEDLGYIRRHKFTGARGGRPSEVIERNPLEPMDKTDKTLPERPSVDGYGHFVHVAHMGAASPAPTSFREVSASNDALVPLPADPKERLVSPMRDDTSMDGVGTDAHTNMDKTPKTGPDGEGAPGFVHFDHVTERRDSHGDDGEPDDAWEGVVL
jgi:replicative DNA helicase